MRNFLQLSNILTNTMTVFKEASQLVNRVYTTWELSVLRVMGVTEPYFCEKGIKISAQV